MPAWKKPENSEDFVQTLKNRRLILASHPAAAAIKLVHYATATRLDTLRNRVLAFSSVIKANRYGSLSFWSFQRSAFRM